MGATETITPSTAPVKPAPTPTIATRVISSVVGMAIANSCGGISLYLLPSFPFGAPRKRNLRGTDANSPRVSLGVFISLGAADESIGSLGFN
ncbi:hypothetical protein ES703_93641 [subsurface metagenome]